MSSTERLQPWEGGAPLYQQLHIGVTTPLLNVHALSGRIGRLAKLKRNETEESMHE